MSAKVQFNGKDFRKNQAALYATSGDFCRIFKEDMKNLYLLSLVLTADREKAEECFVSGLDDCAKGNQVFKEWARSWARRAVIKNAIQMVAPAAAVPSQIASPVVANDITDQVQPELQKQISAILRLQPFERFVFVLSVLEGYSDRDCTLLLGCTREILIEGRIRALQQIGSPAFCTAGFLRFDWSASGSEPSTA